ncbi:MAG: hypothetical protein KDC34_00315 [Saprospiraceae bacterium]|nr:hypothetical protein [Saprospiraceae bacterium]
MSYSPDLDKKEKSKEAEQKPRQLLEGRDFYFENGFMVFTEYYHKSRGYCCGSGCRHCPWKQD